MKRKQQIKPKQKQVAQSKDEQQKYSQRIQVSLQSTEEDQDINSAWNRIKARDEIIQIPNKSKNTMMKNIKKRWTQGQT